MKTTRKSALAKRISKLTDAKELNKTSLVYNWISSMKTNEKLRPVFTRGNSWKYSSLEDKTLELKSALKKLGIEFSEGNDAPKGGRTGKFIQINTKIINN